jgi:hypothetical protein
MEETLVRTKNFVLRHKIAIIWSVVALEVIYLQHKGIKSLNKFLEEEGLTDKYYHPDA